MKSQHETLVSQQSIHIKSQKTEHSFTKTKANEPDSEKYYWFIRTHPRYTNKTHETYQPACFVLTNTANSLSAKQQLTRIFNTNKKARQYSSTVCLRVRRNSKVKAMDGAMLVMTAMMTHIKTRRAIPDHLHELPRTSSVFSLYTTAVLV